MKIKILIILASFLMVSQVYADEIEYNPDCNFPRMEILTDPAVDIYGTGDYYPHLVNDQKANHTINLTVVMGSPNFTDRIMGGDVEIMADIMVFCDGKPLDLGSHLKPGIPYIREGKTFIELTGQGEFTVPSDSRHCYSESKFYGYNSKLAVGNASTNCIIPGLIGKYNSPDFHVSTEIEYLTKRTVEISREQTNISKQQAEASQRQTEIMGEQTNIGKLQAEIMDKQAAISQQQTEVMREQNFMIIVAAMIGIIGSILGAIIGAYNREIIEKLKEIKKKYNH